MNDLLNRLKEPFPVKAIHWRVGATTQDKSKGIALAYIDSRDVMRRLDDILPLQWQSEILETPSGRVLCRLSLCIDGQWITRTDGAGDTQVEGEKGAISDALKRAAVQFGIGQYLYKLPNVWVELDKYKKIITPPQLPAWATPEGYQQLLAKRAA